MKTLIAIAALCVPAYAGNCHVQQARVVNRHVVLNQATVLIPQSFVPLQYAVPVGVPSYVNYQAAVGFGSAAVGYGSSAVGHPEPQREPVRALAEPEEAPLPMSLINQHCAKCHKPGGSAWKKTELNLTGELSNEMRLHMIQRILSDSPEKRMPRGKQLDSQSIGLLVQEIGAVPTPAPPKPEPEK